MNRQQALVHALLLVLLLVLLVQLNCRLQFLKIKILLVSFARAVNVDLGDDLFVEFDTPSIDRKRQAQS